MSTETKWTPGPLEIMVLVATGKHVAFQSGPPHAYVGMFRTSADAALFVAAQALCEALTSFVAHYPMGINPSLDAAYIAARTALASARGEG